jgi:hypothetical protein
MNTSAADIYSLLTDIPAGAWVAVSEREHRVVTFGTDFCLILKEARERGEELPLIVREPDQNIPLFLSPRGRS